MAHYPGYTVLRTEDCPEQHGTLTLLTHDVSGAAVLLVENEDVNKAFGIGFGTFPSDDTGVFHILEHSVLAGSEKYPVSSPFVQLLKSSMASFLNAMTFPDKTVYPFATPNETDFCNLMDVYLNAVFCPLAMVDSAVFEQEGWHRDADGTVSGVVYNEMQGALASPDAQLQNALQRAMFPDTAYGFVSGGDPASIPALTYEKYQRVYRRHYSADNCCITLYGKMDMADKLARLDKDYLSKMPKAAARPRLTMQDEQPGAFVELPYYTDQPKPDEVQCALAWYTGAFADRERQLGVEILLGALLSTNSSPLKAALLAEQLGVPFLELNQEIERIAGCSVRAIHDLYGANAYRRYERRALEDEAVREDAPAQGDRREPGGVGDADRRTGDPVGEPLVEAARDDGRFDALRDVVHDGADHLGLVEDERLVVGRRVLPGACGAQSQQVALRLPLAAVVLGRAGRGRLEQAGGFALVAGHLDEAQQRRHGVEEPAGRAAGRAVETAQHHLADHRALDAHAVEQAAGGLGILEAAQVQKAERVARRLAHGRRAARQGPVGEMGGADEVRLVADEHLASPQRAVGAVARPVERDADDLAPLVRLGERRSDVGVVVLDLDERRPVGLGALARPLRAQILGVEVAGEDVGVQAEQGAVAVERLEPGGERLGVLEVADMLRDERLVGAGHAERRLLLGAAGEHAGQLAPLGLRGEGQARGRRGDAARAAHRLRLRPHHAHHGVVVARPDGPVVAEPGVRDVDEARHRDLVVADDGLVGEVAARHDERHAGGAQQEVLEGRVGEHGPEFGKVAGHGGGDA